MPQMIIVRNSRSGKDSVNGSTMGTFTGDVWIDPVLAAEGMSVAKVTFTPCARTHWHYHSGGQWLGVLAGTGWVCDRGCEPQRINVGDVVWCPNTTTVVFSNGTNAMVSASLLDSLFSYTYFFKHIITAEEIRRYKPALEVNEMLSGKVGEEMEDIEKIWLVSENLVLFVGARAVDLQAFSVDQGDSSFG